MGESTQAKSGEYVYAIAPARVFAALTAPGTELGIDGVPVRSVIEGELAALVSTIGRAKVRPERKNLSLHNALLKRAMQDGSILPVAFGVIASDEAALRTALRKNRVDLLAQLGRVDGKVEMGLRVVWDVPNLFEYFITARPELRTARDSLSDPQNARRDEMIELGRLFAELLNEERDRHFERIDQVLTTHGVQSKRNPVRGEREVLNLACLIPQTAQDEFERVVTEAAAAFDNHFTFDFNGPWAPHNFVELNLRL